MKKKILFINSHFSTGGSCQVTVNKVQLLKNDFEIKVVEYSFLSSHFVVQRNRMIDLVGEENFYSLQENKFNKLRALIIEFAPDFISMEEFPEMFMDMELIKFIYEKPLPYKIIETTHDSSFNPKNKIAIPDEFVFVSAYSALRYAHMGVPSTVIEYPIDQQMTLTNLLQDRLGFEPDYEHVVIVGLFTKRKNQGYAFELAKKLINYNICFHFVGNQAENFSNYWKPLMEDKPDNCIIWGERSDTQDFIGAADLFLFPSKGEKNDKELNPLVIKEAAQQPFLPKLLFNLDVYLGKYDNKKYFNFLSGDLEQDANKILELLPLTNLQDKKNEELIIIGTYPNLSKREQLTIDCINSLKPLGRKILLLSHYPASEKLQKLVDYYIYDAHNPLTHHSYYTRFYNHTSQYYAEVNINGLKNSNQSFTVLTNLLNGFGFAEKQKFKSAFYITYDVIVQNEDLQQIEKSFKSINNTNKAYLATLNTPFGKGIQTTAMTFDIAFFNEKLPYLRDADAYNQLCKEIASENFLEDFLIKVVNRWDAQNYILITNQAETFLTNSGLGVSSNSEYYSILPVKGKENTFIFYFFTYNIDDRYFKLYIDDGNYHFMNTIEISKKREYMHEFTFSGNEVSVTIEFYDGESMYKREQYLINKENIANFHSTGYFEWKNQKPKIKLVHLQTTRNDEKEQKSREQLEKVRDYGWEYILHTNIPYTDLPPKHNCQRPDCVSYELFDEQTIQRIGTALSPSHFGCYLAFKEAILTEFEDCDFLMICEGDCKLDMPIEDFIKTVESTCPTIIDNNIGYMSYGDKATLEHGWLQSPVVREIPNQDLIYITNHIIGLQCIMFPIKIKKWLKEKLRTEKFDAADLYFNSIFVGSPYNMAIVHKRMTSQFDGYSTIDRTYKTFL
jgi:hypothetical protein